MEGMRSLADIKQVLQGQETYVDNEYGVTIVGVFDSYVRNQQTPSSDVDILIDVDKSRRLDLFDLVRLENYLTDLLGVKADIAIRRNLRKRIGQRILDEVVGL